MRAGESSAHVEVLSGLQVQGGAWDFGGSSANACDDLINADFAFAERLELAKHACSAATAAAAGEGSDGVHGRILQDDVREFAHFLRHSGKGQILIALNQAGKAACVLLREEALGSLIEEITVEHNRAESEQQNQKLMAKNPAQGNIVSSQKTIEGVF